MYDLFVVKITGEANDGITLFIFLSVMVIAYLGAKFRFPNGAILAMIAIYSVFISTTLQQTKMLTLVLLVMGIIVSYVIQRLVGSK